MTDSVAVEPRVTEVIGEADATVPKRSGRRRPSAAVASSLALMLSAVGSGLLTFAFWAIIARTHGPAVVGRASAEVSAITFLAGVGSLNMINVFARFLPQAGDRARRLVLISYAAALTAGLIVAVVFLATPWSKQLVVGGTPGRFAFAVLVVCVSVFMIQDGGLVWFGKALWVPVENITVGLGRLAALPVLALVGSAFGAVCAWAGATVVAVLVINALIVWRLSIAHRDVPANLPRTTSLVKFIAVESVTTAVGSSLFAFLPAIVEHVKGSAVTGYFYLPWLIATTVSLLLMGVLISMVRELAASPTGTAAVVRGQLRLIGIVLGGVLAVCCIDPGLLMDILGANFGRQSGTLLRWVGLSVPGTAVALLFWSFCLLDQRPWPIFAMNVSNAVLVIAGVIWLGRHSPISDIGELYCCVQWAIAAVALFPLLRRLRRSLNHQVGPC